MIPKVLTIAGFDPSAGAGILADIKTFEQCGVYGFAACSALTKQSETEFLEVTWLDAEQIIGQIDPLLKTYPVQVAKIGIIKDQETLEQLIQHLQSKNIRIVWDPILTSSSGQRFHQELDAAELAQLIDVITPNLIEAQELFPQQKLKDLSCDVYLKGGHTDSDLIKDILYSKHQEQIISHQRISKGDKHGSGCVLSAALTAHLAKGEDFFSAAHAAQKYTQKFLTSTENLLGRHI